MCTQKIANISNHIQDHSRLGLENKSLENKSGRIFLRSTGVLYKFLPTNLGVCKPTFYIFYHTDLLKNAVFHNFLRQIARSRVFAMNFHRVVLQYTCNNECIIIIIICYYLMVSVITLCNLLRRLIRATFLSTPASDVHER